jgi:hypothetical protein
LQESRRAATFSWSGLSTAPALGHLSERALARGVTADGEPAVSKIRPGKRDVGTARALVAGVRTHRGRFGSCSVGRSIPAIICRVQTSPSNASLDVIALPMFRALLDRSREASPTERPRG